MSGRGRASRLLLLGALVSPAVLGDEPVRAGGLALGLDPPRIECRVKPGEERTEVVSLRNGGGDPLTIKVSAEAFAIDENGNVVSRRRGSPRDAAAWIRVNPATVQIPAGETAPVRVTVRVPADAPAGLAWALLAAETISGPSGGSDDERGLSVGLRLGSYVYVEVGKPAAPSVEAEVQPDAPAAAAGAGVSATATVIHRAGGVLRLQARWRLLSRDGKVLREETSPLTLLPDSRRIVHWSPALAAGSDRFELRLEASGVKVVRTAPVGPPGKSTRE